MNTHGVLIWKHFASYCMPSLLFSCPNSSLLRSGSPIWRLGSRIVNGAAHCSELLRRFQILGPCPTIHISANPQCRRLHQRACIFLLVPSLTVELRMENPVNASGCDSHRELPDLHSPSLSTPPLRHDGQRPTARQRSAIKFNLGNWRPRIGSNDSRQ